MESIHHLEWNGFTLFFTGVFISLAITLLVVRRLHEPKAASMENLIREILIHSPQRLG